MSLVEPSPPGPVHVLLTKVSNAWGQANRDEALRSCYAAMRCANQANDLAGLALAQLYLADTHARCEHWAEGANWARRAIRRFRLLNNNRNAMAAHLLLARLERSLRNLDEAQMNYQRALDLCRKLQAEEKRTARREAAAWYEGIAEEIQGTIADISTTVTGQFDQTYRLDFIPILYISDGPDRATVERSDVVGHLKTTGEFLIAGRTYHLYPLGEVLGSKVELKPDAPYFALAIPEDGWLDPVSKKGDYVLVQKQLQATQEGPGVVWTGENWMGGQFERDATTGEVRFVSPRPHIIGAERGYVVGLLKPRT